jgi:hypothetical protein
VKDFYSKIYKTLNKEMEETSEDGSPSHVYGSGKLILFKCPHYPK